MTQSIVVLGVGSVTPLSRAGEQPGQAEKLDLSLLERTLRRSLSDVTRLFMHAAKQALDDARVSAEHTHVIFASAFGEIGAAEALLAEAYDANGSSPARFRHSVHNTATGLLSISTKNQRPCTALAAGWETVPMALFEACAQLASDATPVLLVYAEERVPGAFSEADTHDPLAVALVLAREALPHTRLRGSLRQLRRAPRGARENDTLSRRPASGADSDERDSARLNSHPLAGALTLARKLERGESGTILLSEGARPWCIDLACSDLACSDLACGDLACIDLAGSELAGSELTCSKPAAGTRHGGDPS